MIREHLPESLNDPKKWEWTTGIVGIGLLVLFTVGFSISIFRYFWPLRTRMLPDVFIAGLEDGKRSLQQASEHFTFNCDEMLLEGYEKVFFEGKYHPIQIGTHTRLDQWWLLLCAFSRRRAADDSHSVHR